MSNPIIPAMMQKIARDATVLGLVVTAQGYVGGIANVQIQDGGNTLWVSYLTATFTPAGIGGVDPSISPYLGIGTSTPGQLTLQNSAGTTVSSVLDSQIAAQVLAILAGRANDIVIANNSNLGAPVVATDQLAYLRGSADTVTLGQ